MTCELHKTSRELSFCLSQFCREPEFICIILDIPTMRRTNSPNLMSGKKGRGERKRRRAGRLREREGGRQKAGRRGRQAAGKERRILGHYCFYTVSSSLAINKLICTYI